jgi:hypothetical protein
MRPATTTHRGPLCIVLWLAVAALGGCGYAGGAPAEARAGDAARAASTAPAEGAERTGGATLLQLRLELVPGIGSIHLSEVDADTFSIELTLDRRVRKFGSALNAASCVADTDWLLRNGGTTRRAARFNHSLRHGI